MIFYVVRIIVDIRYIVPGIYTQYVLSHVLTSMVQPLVMYTWRPTHKPLYAFQLYIFNPHDVVVCIYLGVVLYNIIWYIMLSVREVVEKLGYSVTRDDDSLAYLLWNDTFVSTERISEMKSFQRINHFPGMGEICRKDCLARNMAKYATVFLNRKPVIITL